MSGALLGKQLGIGMVVVCDKIENKRSILLSLKVIPAFCDIIYTVSLRESTGQLALLSTNALACA